MFKSRIRLIACVTALVGAAACLAVSAAWADHTCDPVADVGWTTVPSHETTGQTDSAPYRDGTGDWFVDRTITVLPMCNYFNQTGIYSMRSYSLSPRITKERIGICRSAAGGGSVAVPPYAGPCPPS
jgi:hypothetical protein